MNGKELDILLNKIANEKYIHTIKKSHKFTYNNDKIFLFPPPRHETIGKHKHPYIEMIYVYTGVFKQTINNKEVSLSEGDICILDTNVYHSYEPLGEDDIIINILISKSFFDINFMGMLYNNDVFSNFLAKEMNDKKIVQYLIFKSMKSESIKDIMTKLLCEFYDKTIGYETVIRLNILLLFTELLRIKKLSSEEDPINQYNDSVISKINNYLKENYKDATLKKVAIHFNYHPVYMSDFIKNKTGINFKDMIQEYKLKEACILLESTNLSISEIINKVGYSNTSYFYKIFKEHFHVTPNLYRDKQKLNC